jgi:hypothetical protein
MGCIASLTPPKRQVSGFRGKVAGERKQQAAGERKYALKAGILLKRKVIGGR